MRERLSVVAVVAVLLFAACDIAETNPAPPGDPPASSDPSATSGGGSTAGDPSAPSAPVGGGTGGGAADGGTAGGGAPPPPVAAATYQVKVVNMQFVDARSNSTTSTCKVGDTIVWNNIDSMDHTATSDTGVFNGNLAQGGSFKFTFTKAGTYTYKCLKHSSTMKGTVTVTP
jgi:plastocyanin